MVKGGAYWHVIRSLLVNLENAGTASRVVEIIVYEVFLQRTRHYQLRFELIRDAAIQAAIQTIWECQITDVKARRYEGPRSSSRQGTAAYD
jgi:hypothetical protein